MPILLVFLLLSLIPLSRFFILFCAPERIVRSSYSTTMSTIYTFDSFSAFQASREAPTLEVQEHEWYEPFDPFILEMSGIITKEVFGAAQTKALCSITYILNNDDEDDSEIKKDFPENKPNQSKL